ncbi:MAG: SPFH domain-containing protein, partial [Pseudomonadota bacterium]
MIETIQGLVVPIVAIVVLLVFVGLVLARLYRRSTREVSLVKTGAGGRRVIMDGGTIVIPLLHEISPVNMKTLRLEVRRWGEGSLITKDRMRVDVGVEFYVSVQANEDGIAKAAQTLGDKTFNIEGLREMIEGKLVDGLRSVAAKMSMDELHENRAEFVQQVQNAVSEDLLKNGLMLETVSLTALDQTPFDSLDENNAFNAIGMRKLAEVIAESKKRRAEIDAEAETAVRQSAMEAAKRKLTIDREEEEA